MFDRPSIQLGILHNTLKSKGFSVNTFHFNLDALEQFCSLRKGNSAPFSPEEYRGIANTYWQVGLGEWIFAVPPYHDIDEQEDRGYEQLLLERKVPKKIIDVAFFLREHVHKFLQNCLEDVMEFNPRIVGFTSSHSQNVPSLVLARMIKEHPPSTQVVFGGANCDSSIGIALHRAFFWVDAVIRGEADLSFPTYVGTVLKGNQLDRLSAIPGLCFRVNGSSIINPQNSQTQVLMDDVAVPDYDDYFDQLENSEFKDEILPRLQIPFESSRGCWWGAIKHCTFCGLNGSSMAFRSKSSERVFEDIRHLSSRYKQTSFAATDDIIDMKHVETLLPLFSEMRLKGYDFRFFYETKANLRKEQLKAMRNAGVSTLQPGIESLSSPILRMMRKGTTALQNIRLLKWAAQFDIQILWNLIYGFPGEPAEEYAHMADTIQSLTHLQPPNVSRLLINRFSPYQQEAERFGLKVSRPQPFYKFIYRVEANALDELAYDFSHMYSDGRNDLSYARPVKEAAGMWKSIWHRNSRFLTYSRGIDFLTITDTRPNLDSNIYKVDETEAQIYLACDAGATVTQIIEHVRNTCEKDLSRNQISDYLNQLVGARLMYQEGDAFLSLAISVNYSEREVH